MQMQSLRSEFERTMRKDQLHRRRRATSFVPLVCACALLFAFATRADAAARAAWRYEVIALHPHDTAAFTQGLALVDGRLLESRGGYGRSAITLRDLASGAVLRERRLQRRYFGEGVASLGPRIVQLTWHSGLAFVYDTQLRETGRFRYDGEGWGLASDGVRWFMSDGSDRLTVRDGATFAVTGRLPVRDGSTPIDQINELEFAQGRLFANVWHQDRVAVIDPGSGAVQAWIDLSALKRGFAKPAGWDAREHVLNGIAYDPARRHFFVTGKCWPVLFELRFVEP